MEASKEDESPFDLSEDSPPALYDVISNTHKKKGKDHTDITHGAMIWNAVISLVSCGRPGNQSAYYSEDDK